MYIAIRVPLYIHDYGDITSHTHVSVYTHTSVVVFTVHDAHVTSIALVLSFAIHCVCIYNSVHVYYHTL